MQRYSMKLQKVAKSVFISFGAVGAVSAAKASAEQKIYQLKWW